jgi:hypothetical protein
MIGADGNMGYNRYMYAAGNPVKFNDPTGHFILEAMLIGAIFGAVIGAVSGYISYGISTGDWAMSNSEAAWTEIGIGAAVGLLAGIAGAAAGAGIVAGAGLTGLEAAIVGGFYAGAAGGFVGGASNTWFHGGSFEDGMLAGVQGAIIGGAVGGAMGAITYGITDFIQGNNPTSNSGETDLIAMEKGRKPFGDPSIKNVKQGNDGYLYGEDGNGQMYRIPKGSIEGSNPSSWQPFGPRYLIPPMPNPNNGIIDAKPYTGIRADVVASGPIQSATDRSSQKRGAGSINQSLIISINNRKLQIRY